MNKIIIFYTFLLFIVQSIEAQKTETYDVSLIPDSLVAKAHVVVRNDQTNVILKILQTILPSTSGP